MEVAESIRGAVEGYRFEWQESFTTVRTSIGVVISDLRADNVASLMSSADVACYSAKDMGRNQVHLYKDSDASLRHEEMKWVSRITSAVEEDRFELYYQPIIGINDESGDGRGHYELLLRMRDRGRQSRRTGPVHPSSRTLQPDVDPRSLGYPQGVESQLADRSSRKTSALHAG